MIKYFVIFSLLLFTAQADAQYLNSTNPQLKSNDGFSLNLKSQRLYKKADIPTSLYVMGIISFISPMVVFEDKKTFFALTKEISFGKFSYGRFSFEYSYVFRSYNSSHIRLSYNYDFILEASDFIAFVATPGAGYFTDTKNKGWFLQASAGPFLIFAEPWVVHPYLRYRHTFIKDKSKTDINDISLGAAFILYF